MQAMGNGKESLIDKEHHKQRQKEEAYRANMLLKVIEVVKFLGERRLALRGDNHLIGNSNDGNFLGLMDVADHIARHGHKGSWHPSYIPTSTMEEVVIILGKELRNTIIESKYT